MSFHNLYKKVSLQVERLMSPYPNLAISKAELAQLLNSSSLKDDKSARVLIENVNFSLPSRFKLFIVNNNIDENAAKAIAAAVYQNKELTQAKFENCALTEKTATVIIEGLKSCPNLETLNLSNNPIEDDGVAALCPYFMDLNQIQNLNLGLVKLGDNAAKALADVIKNHKTLKKLEVAEYNLSENAQKLLKDAAATRPDFQLSVIVPRQKKATACSASNRGH